MCDTPNIPKDKKGSELILLPTASILCVNPFLLFLMPPLALEQTLTSSTAFVPLPFLFPSHRWSVYGRLAALLRASKLRLRL